MEAKEIIRKVLHGFHYRDEIPESIVQLAKKENILIAYGASDDLLELQGAYDDEFGAFGGWDYKTVEFESDDPLAKKILLALELELLWCPNAENSWAFKLGKHVEYVEFDIIEDDEVFCKGVIIQLKG